MTQTQQKPNIVVILMDNLGWGELGVYGGGILRGAPTPRIDQLAAEGMRPLNFNVEAQCTPSRAAFITGRYAVRTGNGSVPIETPVYRKGRSLDVRDSVCSRDNVPSSGRMHVPART